MNKLIPSFRLSSSRIITKQLSRVSTKLLSKKKPTTDLSERIKLCGKFYNETVHAIIDRQITDVVKKHAWEQSADKLHDDFLDRLTQPNANQKKQLRLFLGDLSELLHQAVPTTGKKSKYSRQKAFKWLNGVRAIRIWRRPIEPINSSIQLDADKRLQLHEHPAIQQLTLEQIDSFLDTLRPGSEPSWFMHDLSTWEQDELKDYLWTVLNDIGITTLDNLTDQIKIKFSQTLNPPPHLYRKVPGLANHFVHTASVSEEANPNSHYQFSNIRISIPVPIDMKSDRQQFVTQNIEQLIETHVTAAAEKMITDFNIDIKAGETLTLPILIQTLVSPMWLFGLGNIYYETRMVKEKEAAIQDYLAKHPEGIPVRVNINNNPTIITLKADIISTNHSLNFGGAWHEGLDAKMPRFVLDKRIQQNTDNGVHLINAVSRYIELIQPWLAQEQGTKKEKIKSNYFYFNNLQQLLSSNEFTSFDLSDSSFDSINADIQQCLSSQFRERQKTNDTRLLLSALSQYIKTQRDLAQGKQARTKELTLYLASLESFVAGGIGVASGSCKSGKDRKGTVLMYMDAMLADFATHQRFRSYQELSQDPSLPQQIKKIFQSNHHQQVSAIGSGLGTDGIKNLNRVFPQRIAKAFTQNELSISNKIASLNKPKSLTTAQTRSRIKKLMKQNYNHPTPTYSTQRKRITEGTGQPPQPERSKQDQLTNQSSPVAQTLSHSRYSPSTNQHSTSLTKKKSVKIPLLLGVILLPTVVLSALCFVYAYKLATKKEKQTQSQHKLRPYH